MEKIIKFIKKKDLIYYIIILVVAIIVSLPLLKISLLGTGDSRLHLLRILGLRNAIQSSNFPYIITPFYCNNFGYATNLFYPQLTTYLPYILKVFTTSYENAMELFTFLTIFLSGIFMYNFTKELSNNKVISLISSIIYITFPYRFECIYERCAIGEFTALVFLPILFQGLYNLINKDKSKHYLIAVGAAGLLLCHTITTVYAAIFCVIYILFNAKKFFKKDILKLCFIDFIFIIMITALFTVPLLEHKFNTEYTIFDADSMHGLGIDVFDNSASFKQLFTDVGSDKTVSFIIGTPIIVYLILGIWAYKKIDEDNKKWYNVFGLLGIISLFMVTKLFPWLIMPSVLTMIQFTWRILVFFNLFISPICGVNIYTILKNIKTKKFKFLFMGICIIILVCYTGFRFKEYVQEKTESGAKYTQYEERMTNNKKISHMSINREYLPIKSDYEYMANREDIVYVLKGECNISNEKKQALEMSFDFKDAENAELELPFIYYLGYEIKLNNEEVLKYSESDVGFVKINIPQDTKEGSITIKYTGTVLEKASYIVSLLGLVLFIIYIIIYKRDKHERNN